MMKDVVVITPNRHIKVFMDMKYLITNLVI